MLQRCSRREAHCQSQRRYEARQRDGVGLYPVPLGCREIDLLIALGWLPEGEEANRERVGEAVANALRELGRAVIADRLLMSALPPIAASKRTSREVRFAQQYDVIRSPHRQAKAALLKP